MGIYACTLGARGVQSRAESTSRTCVGSVALLVSNVLAAARLFPRDRRPISAVVLAAGPVRGGLRGVHSQTFLCLLDPHQVSLRAVRQIIFLNHSCLSKGTTNRCRHHQCMRPRCIKESCRHPTLVPTILKATTLGNKVAWVPCLATGPPQGPAGYPAGRMGTQGGYPYGNSQYGGYGGANSLMPPPPGPQYPKAAGAASTMGGSAPAGARRAHTSHVPAPAPSAEDVRLQQPHDAPGWGWGLPISVGRWSPLPPGGGPMPPGACYSQCPPAPMSGPSSLLSQQGGVGGSPPVTGPGQDGGGGGRSQLAPPPTVLDEGSQASNAKQPPMSHPPTPNTLPSPGGASMSSFHDEFESVSSPSWPRTPASPVVNSQVYEHHMIKRPDGLLKLYDMSEDPERRAFLDKLIVYNDERGTPITQCPTISKQPLDLFRLYLIVKDRGGFVEVTKAKHWKDVAGVLGIGASSSAAYTLRKQYIKHLLPFECKFDRGGIDPQPIISQLESASRKKTKGTMSPSGASQDYGPPAQTMESYPTSGGYHPGAPYPPSGPPPA
ncbi:hypothetical protein MTO96_049470 [Rhipicephalus appendiculatus]